MMIHRRCGSSVRKPHRSIRISSKHPNWTWIEPLYQTIVFTAIISSKRWFFAVIVITVIHCVFITCAYSLSVCRITLTHSLAHSLCIVSHYLTEARTQTHSHLFPRFLFWIVSILRIEVSKSCQWRTRFFAVSCLFYKFVAQLRSFFLGICCWCCDWNCAQKKWKRKGFASATLECCVFLVHLFFVRHMGEEKRRKKSKKKMFHLFPCSIHVDTG